MVNVLIILFALKTKDYKMKDIQWKKRVYILIWIIVSASAFKDIGVLGHFESILLYLSIYYLLYLTDYFWLHAFFGLTPFMKETTTNRRTHPIQQTSLDRGWRVVEVRGRQLLLTERCASAIGGGIEAN